MTHVLIHGDQSIIDSETYDQIKLLKEHPAFHGLIAIMPDAHAGKGCVIGFTGKFKDLVIPNIVGVDIGCGVYAVELPEGAIHNKIGQYELLDKHIRGTIPLGTTSREIPSRMCILLGDELREICNRAEDFLRRRFNKYTVPYLQIGTLGGGNHFIEIDRSENTGKYYLIVHSGSRNFGLKVATYFQEKAKDLCEKMKVSVPQGMEYLPMDFSGEDYMSWMQVAQRYAHYNRLAIICLTLEFFGGAKLPSIISSVHNYIDSLGMIRKGAIEASEGKEVIIPLSMADGCVLGVGKGNKAYNYSAPHGAGRIHGRKEMKRMLEGEDSPNVMKTFIERMGGIYSTCITNEHIDESPMAYKDFESIRKFLEPTVTVTDRLRPVYVIKG